SPAAGRSAWGGEDGEPAGSRVVAGSPPLPGVAYVPATNYPAKVVTCSLVSPCVTVRYCHAPRQQARVRPGQPERGGVPAGDPPHAQPSAAAVIHLAPPST